MAYRTGKVSRKWLF